MNAWVQILNCVKKKIIGKTYCLDLDWPGYHFMEKQIPQIYSGNPRAQVTCLGC